MDYLAVTDTPCITAMPPRYFWIIYILLYKIRPYHMCKDYDHYPDLSMYIPIAIRSYTCKEIAVDGILRSQQERRSKEVDDPAEYDHACVAAPSGLQERAGCGAAGEDPAKRTNPFSARLHTAESNDVLTRMMRRCTRYRSASPPPRCSIFARCTGSASPGTPRRSIRTRPRRARLRPVIW